MGNYITVTDMAKLYDVNLLTLLTNDDEAAVDPTYDINNIDTDVLDAVIDYQLAIIANYLREIRTDAEPTGSSTGNDIKGIACALVWCALWERKGSEPEQVTKLREFTTDRLHKMALMTEEQMPPDAARAVAKMGDE